MKCRQIATGLIWVLVSLSVVANAQEEPKEEEASSTAQTERVPQDEWEEGKTLEPVNTILKSPIPGGAYGAILLSTGKIGNTAGTMLGARGAWMLSRNWGVGIAARTLSSQYDDRLPDDYSLIYRYNGLTLEYTWSPLNRFHWNTVLLLGEGRIALGDQYGRGERQRDFFPIAELEINGEWNLTPYARFFLGVNQRWVEATQLAGFKPEDFMHPQAQLGLKLGML